MLVRDRITYELVDALRAVQVELAVMDSASADRVRPLLKVALDKYQEFLDKRPSHHYVVMSYDPVAIEWLVKEYDHFCPYGGIRTELSRHQHREHASQAVQDRKKYWEAQGELQ